MLRTSSSQVRSAGFSLLELLLVVAVGAVLILAGLGAYRLVSEGSNTNRAVQQLSTLKQQVQQAFAGQGTYGAASADLVATLNTMHALPSDMAVSGTTVRDAFGGAATVTVGTATNTFVVTLPSVPTSSCITLGQLFTPANSSDFVSLKVGSTTVSTYTTSALSGNTLCGAGATVAMGWTFR